MWPWALSVFVLFLVIAGTGFALSLAGDLMDTDVRPTRGQATPTASVGDGYSPPQTQTTQAADTGPSFPGKQPKDYATGPGEWVTYSGGVNVVAAPLQPYRPGAKRLCTQVTIQNESSRTTSFYYGDWKLQNPAGVIREAEYFDNKNRLESGELAAGGSISGLVCFPPVTEMTPGTWVVLMEPGFLSNERIAWINRLTN